MCADNHLLLLEFQISPVQHAFFYDFIKQNFENQKQTILSSHLNFKNTKNFYDRSKNQKDITSRKLQIFSKIRNSPDSRTHPRNKIRSQKGKQRNHSNFGIKIILVIFPFKFTRFPILPDNPKLLAPLEILCNFRRPISHQSPFNLRTDGKKLGHFELAILHTFLPSVRYANIYYVYYCDLLNLRRVHGMQSGGDLIVQGEYWESGWDFVYWK